MPVGLMLEISVLIVLAATANAAWRMPASGRSVVPILATAALAGAMAGLAIELGRVGWHGDLAFTLRACLVATLLAYVAIGWMSLRVRRLGLLLLPYLVLIGALALVVGQSTPVRAATPVAPIAWYDTHIALALATYGLLSLAAMAGLACLMQEAALKRKATGGLAARLPAVSDSEQVEIRLLAAAEIVLGIGIATGMALAWLTAGEAMPLDHKSILAIAVFLLIGALLVAHRLSGYRGRRAARWVLVAWLLLTLAYPGVKFVREILLG
jgi:ABC-type uncharacterized transport system permease subunit